MATDINSILSDLNNNKYAPIYFLQGEEPFFIDQVSDFIEANALDEAAKGFNQVVLYGKDVSIADVINNAKRFPMMSERQVVIVKEAQNIKDLNKEAGDKLFGEYLDNPLPSTILVMCHKYKKLDQRKKLGKEVAKKTVFLDTKKLYDNQVPDWIKGYVKSVGFTITEEAAYLLANFIGNNLERIANELKKIQLNLKDVKEIKGEHIHKFIGVSKEFNVFELTNALAFKNSSKAFGIAQYFAANPKENPVIMVIAVLFSFFSRLLLVHSLSDKSEKGISSALRVPFFAAKEYKQAIANYPPQKLEYIIAQLRYADMQSKGINANSLEDEEILNELIFKILY